MTPHSHADDHAAFEAPSTIRAMLLATWTFLSSLSPSQRSMCDYPMDHPGRSDWDFIPKPDRHGIPLTQLDSNQRQLAHQVLRTGLSLRGYTQALEIMAMENVLRELEWPELGLATREFRHSELYYLSFFGQAQRDGAPDPRCRTGDHRDPVLQSSHTLPECCAGEPPVVPYSSVCPENKPAAPRRHPARR